MSDNDSPTPSERVSSPIVELRQYTLHPSRRATFIDLFDSTFVESQEAVGMTVIGQFRDLDDPDRFIWLRGYPTMADRAWSLGTFYDGPVWHANRAAANSAMIDTDDVLLLRPARPDSGFQPGARQPLGVDLDVDPGVVEATVLSLAGPADAAVAHFESEIAPVIAHAGFSLLAYLITETTPNNFPRHPLREGENILAWFAGCADRLTYERTMRGQSGISDLAAGTEGLLRTPQTLRLEPTSRSALTGSSQGCPAASRRATTTSR